MRILQIINSLSCGGAETFVVQLCTVMAERNEVHLLSYAGMLDGSGEKFYYKLNMSGVNVISLNIKDKYLKPMVPFLYAYHIGKINPNIVHVHLDQSELFTAFAIMFTNLKIKPVFIRTLHNTRISVAQAKVLQNFISSKYAGTVACSNAVYDSNEYKKFKIKNFIKIDNGITIPEVERNSETINKYKAKLCIEKDKFVLLNIGSFTPRGGVLQKAQDSIIKALAMIPDIKNILVIFLGDGTQRKKIESLAKSLGVIDSCRFEGFVGNVYEYVLGSNVLLMPSRFEGLSLAALECACIGLPIIVSDIDSFKDIAYRNSIICKRDSDMSIRDAVCYAINNYEMINSCAIDLTSTFKKKFNINLAAERYLRFYKKVLEGYQN